MKYSRCIPVKKRCGEQGDGGIVMNILMIQTLRVGDARPLSIPLMFIRTYICGMRSSASFIGAQHQIQGLCKPSVDLF